VDGHDGDVEGAVPGGPPVGSAETGPAPSEGHSGPSATPSPPSPGDLMAAASQRVRSRPLLTAGLSEGVHRRVGGGIAGAMAAVAGGLVALGVTVVALRGDPSPWIVALVGALLLVLGMALGLAVRGWGAVTGWPVGPLASTGTVLALGGAAVFVAGLAVAVSEDSSSTSIVWWPYLLLGGVLLVLWLLPGVQGRPAVLGAALLSLVFATTAFVAVQEVEDDLSSGSGELTAFVDESNSSSSTLRGDDATYSFGYTDGYADGYDDGGVDGAGDDPYRAGYDPQVGGDDSYAFGYDLGYSVGYDDGFYDDEYDDSDGDASTDPYAYDDVEEGSITAFSTVGSSPFGLFGVAGDAWTTAAWVALALGVVLVLASAAADHVGWHGISTPMVFVGLVAAITGGIGVTMDAGVLEYLVLGVAALLVMGVGAVTGRRATTWIAAALVAALVVATLDEALDPGADDTVLIGVAVLIAGIVAGGVAVSLALWVQPVLDRQLDDLRDEPPPDPAAA